VGFFGVALSYLHADTGAKVTPTQTQQTLARYLSKGGEVQCFLPVSFRLEGKKNGHV
jgi:hypothetical protein